MLKYAEYVKQALSGQETMDQYVMPGLAGVGAAHLGGSGAQLLAKLLGSKDPKSWYIPGAVAAGIGTSAALLGTKGKGKPTA